MKWTSSASKISTIFLLSQLLTACMTSSLSDKIQKNESPHVIENDKIFGISASNDIGQSNVTKLILLGQKHNYKFNTSGQILATLLKQDTFDQDAEFQLENQFQNKFTLNKEDFSTNLEQYFYYTRPNGISEADKKLLIQGFKLCSDCSRPTMIYGIKASDGKILPAGSVGSALTFFPTKIILVESRTHFSGLRLFYPFTIIGDIITSPFQLIAYGFIKRSVPAMKY